MEYFSYFSFIISKMLFFIFWPLPEKLLDCPKKNYFARLWGAAAHLAPQLIRLWLVRQRLCQDASRPGAPMATRASCHGTTGTIVNPPLRRCTLRRCASKTHENVIHQRSTATRSVCVNGHCAYRRRSAVTGRHTHTELVPYVGHAKATHTLVSQRSFG